MPTLAELCVRTLVSHFPVSQLQQLTSSLPSDFSEKIQHEYRRYRYDMVFLGVVLCHDVLSLHPFLELTVTLYVPLYVARCTPAAKS